MESIILLNSNENTRKVEDEEKSRFVRSILESIEGLPPEYLEDIWDEKGEVTLAGKIKLRQTLHTFDLEVIGAPGGDLQVYHVPPKGEHTLIGEWKKPFYVLKKDASQRDPAKRFYIEMRVNYWSAYENTE